MDRDWETMSQKSERKKKKKKNLAADKRRSLDYRWQPEKPG